MSQTERAAFWARYESGQRAEGVVNRKLRGGRVVDGMFLTMAPGPVEIEIERVPDFRVLADGRATE